MADDKRRLITSILHFLRSEFRSGQLSAENQEGLEVAIQCLESVYDITETSRSEPSLLEIYKAYLVPTIVQKPNVTEDEKHEAEQLKVKGNTAMSGGKYYHALEFYSRAIEIDPKNAVYYCNRAAAHSKLQNHNAAIIDCKIALEIDPKYSKAYGRLGLAYCGIEDYENALIYYKKAVEIEPTNEGYIKNYELAVQKASVTTTAEVHATSSTEATLENSGLSLQDFNMLMGNPHLLNIATQMLADPSMQSMMSNLVSDGFGNDRGTGIQQLINVGQRLAQQMHSENPHFVAELRSALGFVANEGENQPGQPDPSERAEESGNDNEEQPSNQPEDQRDPTNTE